MPERTSYSLSNDFHKRFEFDVEFSSVLCWLRNEFWRQRRVLDENRGNKITQVIKGEQARMDRLLFAAEKLITLSYKSDIKCRNIWRIELSCNRYIAWTARVYSLTLSSLHWPWITFLTETRTLSREHQNRLNASHVGKIPAVIFANELPSPLLPQ